MKRVVLAFLFCFASLIPASATTVYVAATAGPVTGGTLCNTHTAIALGSITWTAGNTYILCGTFTASAGAGGYFTVGASGTSGNPITIEFDSNTEIQAPYWGTNGAINFNNESYITLNCLNQGNIRSTANGGGLTYQQPPYGANDQYPMINMGLGSNNTVENCSLGPTYMHYAPILVTGASGTGTTATLTLASACPYTVGNTVWIQAINPSGYNNVAGATVTACTGSTISYANTTTASYVSGGFVTDENGFGAYGIMVNISGSSGNATNLTITNNTIHDGHWCIYGGVTAGATLSNVTVTHNTIYNCEHDIGWFDNNDGLSTWNGTNIFAYNVFHDWANWDDQIPGNSGLDGFHHDGLHTGAQYGSSGSQSQFSGFQIHDNYMYGNPGQGMTAMLYLFGNCVVGSQGCFTTPQVYNNVFVNGSPSCVGNPANGQFLNWTTGSNILNNVFLGCSTSNTTTPAVDEYTSTAGTGSVYKNNIFEDVNIGIYMPTGSGTGYIAASDYNDFYNVGSVGHDTAGNYYTALTGSGGWQSCVAGGCPASHDTNSVSGNPLLNASSTPPYQLTSSSSAAYRTGTNLTSAYCGTIPALCTGADGNARPSSGAWDIGPDYFGGGTSYTLTQTNIGSGVVTAVPSGISCPSTCSASYASGTNVVLTETPSTGYYFDHWSGACASTITAKCTVAMTSAQSVTATYTALGGCLSPYPNARCDLTYSPLPATTPNVGNLIGAGTCIIDPQFGSTVCRITDNNTNTPGAQVNSALLANDSGSGEMMSISCDDSLAMASNGGGSQFPLIFNPLGNVANARMYKTTDSATNGFVFTGGNFDAWSRICPANNQLAYVTVGSQLVSYNFNGYCDTCTPPNIAGTLIYDFASANGLGSNFHITFNTPGGISQGDTDFIVSFGGAIKWTNSYSYTTGYANGVIAGNLVYPTTGNAGGFIYEATNAPCTGQATGNPTWNQTVGGTNTDGTCTMTNVGTGGQEAIGTQYVMVWRNGSGVRTLNTVTGGVAADWGPTGTIPSWPCVMYTHEARIGKIGGAQGWTYWGAGSPCVPAEHYIWLYAASSLTGSFYASANAAHSGGHATEGMLFYINNVGNSVPDWMQVCYVYGSSNLCPATSSAYGVTGSTTLPAPTGTGSGIDMHLGTNWLNDAMPVCASTTTLGTPPSPKAWQNEIMCFPTTYTAGVNPFRFASTENSSLSSSFYISNAIGSVSADGNWFLFTSDWEGTLGSSSGGSTCVITSTCRSDLFAVQLGGSTTPQASTPTFSLSSPYTGPSTVLTISAATGPVICYNLTGSPATNGTTGCAVGSTLYSSLLTISGTQTIYAVAGGTGYTDSSVGIWVGTITSPPVAAPWPAIFTRNIIPVISEVQQ